LLLSPNRKLVTAGRVEAIKAEDLDVAFASLASLDHFIGAGEQSQRYGEAKRLSRAEIDDQLKLCRLMNC
jgi:hypothetical protein